MDGFALVGTVYLAASAVSAAAILVDVCRHPQPMAVMNVVWVLTALWAGPVGLGAYLWFGRATRGGGTAMAGMDGMAGMDAKKPMAGMAAGAGGGKAASGDAQPFWQKIAKSSFHCGAGCTVADLIGESIGTALLVSLGLRGIVAQWVLDYVLALATGAIFQFMAIRPMMRDLPASRVFLKALKIDALSLTAWQVGMYTVSGILLLAVFPGLSHGTPAFWFSMQLAMFGGFACAFPMNRFLVRRGIKPAM